VDLLSDLFYPAQPASFPTADRVVLVLLVALIVGQLNAWCYRWTHRGVSYSRTFTQALVLIAMIAALSMSLVATNAMAALGLLGGAAIIRFRTVVRDARDTAYLFLCLICGMAAGFGSYGTAIVGSIGANLVGLYLHASGFGAWHSPDGLLRFRVDTSALHGGGLDALLRRFCRRYTVVSVDESPSPTAEGGSMCQCAYKVRLRDPGQGPGLVEALKSAFRIEAIHLLVEREHEEVD
jgi:hypothetical protein